jgi:DNA repair protein RadA/Sms
MRNDIDILCETDLEQIIDEATNTRCNVLIVDSIQTIFSEDSTGMQGSVSQVRAATARLTRYAKETGVVVFIVGHVTKDGNIAGPRVLEHIVDTVLYFEGDRHEGLRLLRAVKNRFGSTNEVGVFEMGDCGMREVADPSKLFLSGESAPGCCVTCAMEGSRPILAEVQSLLIDNTFGNPRRTSAGVDIGRLSLLLAVLEKKAHLRVLAKDVYLNVVGGLRLDERSTDLAVALCVASALMDLPLPPHTAALGEVGLTGEVRSLSRIETRLNESVRLGYSTVLLPKSAKAPRVVGLKTIPVATVGEAIAYATKRNCGIILLARFLGIIPKQRGRIPACACSSAG